MTESTQKSYRERILRVLVHIQEHLDEDLSLDALARIAHFSRYHFHRIFKGLVGESLKQHVRRLRLERAAFRLLRTEQDVTTLAFDAGYASHEGFTRAFHALFGLSPTAFRERHRAPWHGPAPSSVHFAPPGEPLDFRPVPRGELEPRSVAPAERRAAIFVRHTGPYLEAAPAWEELLDWAGRRGLPAEGARRAGICHDDPAVTDPDRLRYDACLLVDGDVGGEGAVGVQTLFGGEFAVFRHAGPYEELAPLYETWLGHWLPRSRYEVRDMPCVELYHRGLFDPGTPADWVTDVCVPVVHGRGRPF